LERAIGQDDHNPSFWLNLATAFRRLGLLDDEERALTRALTLQPRHLLALLQKASLLELRGKSRASAQAYRNALATIPPGAQLPASVRGAVERGVESIRRNNAELEAFLGNRLERIRRDVDDADRERFEHALDALLEKRRIHTPRPTLLHYPKLPALEFHPRESFPWLEMLEAATADIREECERVLAEEQDGLEPYIAYPEGLPLDQWAELNKSRRWSAYFLWRDGKPIDDHLQRCPRTASVLSSLPRVDIPRVGPTAFFSILDAGAHIPPHTGVTNSRLIVHLPLVVPDGCRFRVGSETHSWRTGEAWVFDDTIEHEAWNETRVPRAILIFDVWNPFLSAGERELVRAAMTAITDYYGDGTVDGAA
jgi:aspartate beta-hydroxylase